MFDRGVLKRSQLTQRRVNLMYSIVIHTTDSTIDIGTRITSTPKLKEFLCGLDFGPITKLEVLYYRELKSSPITGSMPAIGGGAEELPE